MRYLLPLVLVAFVLAAAGCGDDTKVVTDEGPGGQATTRTVPDVKFAKTKFVLHSGLAFGAFRRYILRPYQEGRFQQGADGRRRALVKAALAGAFAANEVRLARNAALSSDVLRRNLIKPIDAVAAKLKPLVEALKAGGAINPGSVLGAAGAVASLKTLASGQGVEIKDRSAPIPGT
jgi:hypothetical protein